MTKREFLNTVIAANINEETTAHAQHELENLDHTNELRKANAAKKNESKEAERAPMRAAVLECLTMEGKTAAQLIAESGIEAKPQLVPHLLKPLMEEGRVEKTEIKVTGKGKQVAYRLAD